MKTILLVEDDPFMVDVYTKTFAKEAFTVDFAMDGKAALEKINSMALDLLILDIDLPKMSGCEILKIIRSNPKTEKLKVIVLSNYNDEDIRAKYDMDINDFNITRRFLKVETSVEDIVATVKEILI